MAHEISMFEGVAEMAYAGATPWHGLGQKVEADAPIEVWREQAGLNWQINRSPVQYGVPGEGKYIDGKFVLGQELKPYADSHVLWRSDNHKPLSVVSDTYKVVQPEQMLEFYRDLVANEGFQIETIGSLKGGRRIWAMAKTNIEAEVLHGDNVKAYLVLVTSCDGSLATTGMFTSVRVVCNNTMQMALGEAGAGAVKMRHNMVFNPNAMKGKLGLMGNDVFGNYMQSMEALTKIKIDASKADAFLSNLLKTSAEHGDISKTKGYQTLMGLFQGGAIGSQIDGVQGTGWGMLNAVTEYVDHKIRANSNENRLNSAWFGAGANMKQQAAAMLLAA